MRPDPDPASAVTALITLYQSVAAGGTTAQNLTFAPTSYAPANVTFAPTAQSSRISDIFNVLVSTFGIMACGYLLPLYGGVNRDAVAAGIGGLVGRMVLPVVLFKQMLQINPGGLNWQLIGALAAAKVLLFVGTACFWWTIDRRNKSRLGHTALAAVFATNQNDIAIGLPVIPALFPVAEFPQNFVNYLYVTVAINLVVILPMGMILLENTREVHHFRHFGMRRRPRACVPQDKAPPGTPKPVKRPRIMLTFKMLRAPCSPSRLSDAAFRSAILICRGAWPRPPQPARGRVDAWRTDERLDGGVPVVAANVHNGYA